MLSHIHYYSKKPLGASLESLAGVRFRCFFVTTQCKLRIKCNVTNTLLLSIAYLLKPS